MIGAVLLLLAFSLLGYPWTSAGRGRLLLAPAVGLAATILLAYFLSANFDLVGADAVAIAIPLLAGFALVREFVQRHSRAVRYAQFGADLRDAGWALLPVAVLIVPALQHGVVDFFGVGNFDFFYNSQDGWFLASHSVNQFVVEEHDRILPLTWSANTQGRFAVTLLSAFAHKYADFNTLHFNAVMLTSCVATASMATYAFALRVLGFNSRWALWTVMAFIFSAGFAQGYSYFLLGQISAMPLFMAFATSLAPLLNGGGRPAVATSGQTWRDVAVIAFWLNALYVFYAILAFFAGALLVLAALLNTYRSNRSVKLAVVRIGQVLLATLLLFVLVRAFSLPSAGQAIIDWINLSLKTAGTTADGPKVFTEYLTEGFLALLLGLVRYPANTSVFGSLLLFRDSQSVPLLVLSCLGIVCFVTSLVYFAASRTLPRNGKAILGAMVLISLGCGIAFFVSGSGYAIFKIGSWFIPICLIAVVAALHARAEFSGIKRAGLLLTATCLLLLNMVTAFNYAYAFLPLRKLFGYRDSAKIVEMADVRQLKGWLQAQPEKRIELDFLDGIKAAWFANELRDRSQQVDAYSHNLQPLADRQVKPPVCPVDFSRSYEQTLLVTDHLGGDSQDIISMQPAPTPAAAAGRYHVIDMSRTDFYVSLGRGTYPSYTLSDNEARSNALPRTLRWVEKGFELYVYTRRSGYVDISLDAAPGFVVGDETRTLELSGQGVQRGGVFSKKDQRVRYDRIPVKTGMNCLYIESSDHVQNINRYGALFRSAVTLDSRFLNYAIGNLDVHYKD